jgi:hypothetical protein
MLTSAQIQPQSAHMDALIEKLKRTGEGELLIEHLQTAHAYLLGAMPAECEHNLELARDAAREFSARTKLFQDEVNQVVASLV